MGHALNCKHGAARSNRSMTRLIALHGFSGCGEDFKPLSSLLENTREMTAPDWPGHGLKSGLRSEADYSLESHLRMIDEASEGGPVELLGYSMGGRLALHYALARPDQVTRLILVGASPGLRTEGERRERLSADAALADFIRSRGVAAFMHYWHGQTMFQTLQMLPDERRRVIMDSRGRNDPEGLALSLLHAGTGALPSLWDRLHELKMPVDLVTGAHDAKFTALGREMVTLIPRARLGVVEDAGHAVHLERPGDLAAAILRR